MVAESALNSLGDVWLSEELEFLLRDFNAHIMNTFPHEKICAMLRFTVAPRHSWLAIASTDLPKVFQRAS